MKPRQPVAGLLRRPGAKSSRCVSIGKDEKSLREFSDLFSLGGKGFFVAGDRHETSNLNVGPLLCINTVS